MQIYIRIIAFRTQNVEMCDVSVRVSYIIIIFIIIKKRLAVQGWERGISTPSVRRPQPNNTNP